MSSLHALEMDICRLRTNLVQGKRRPPEEMENVIKIHELIFEDRPNN